MVFMNASEIGKALRALQTAPPRAKVPNYCRKCKQTIMGTREFRKHKPLCKGKLKWEK
jgi:hypothetical protein